MKDWDWVRVGIALVLLAEYAVFSQRIEAADLGTISVPDTAQRAAPGLGPQLIASSKFIHAKEARDQFQVDGAGGAVAVLDTGLRVTHKDFVNRVPTQVNFTTDNQANSQDASDGNGHGTNVAGIVAAGKIHIGIAPGANIVPLKVLDNQGNGDFVAVEKALQWVIDNHQLHSITVVNMSLGGSANFASDSGLLNESVSQKIKTLRDLRIPVVVSAGNDFFSNKSAQGMGFPGIIRHTISVGAVFDEASTTPIQYGDGATAFTRQGGAITPFSQRLHDTVHVECRTDIFAPGAPVTSSGNLSDVGSSTQHGTSQAAPVTAGVVRLMQQLHAKLHNGQNPSVDDIEKWLRTASSAMVINDGDDEDDNVNNTNLNFIRLDALEALRAVNASVN